MSKRTHSLLHTPPGYENKAQPIQPSANLPMSRKPDQRFIRHGTQPRGKYLDRRQRKLCRIDDAFKEALRLRVTNTNRWDAFIANSPSYTGKPCKRCHSQRRYVYNGGCYDCLLDRNKGDFQLIRKGVMPPANSNRDSWLDKNERRTREKRGEFQRYEVGRFIADQYPTGRVRLYAPHIHIDTQDMLKGVPAIRLHQLADVDPDFLALLKRLGWA